MNYPNLGPNFTYSSFIYDNPVSQYHKSRFYIIRVKVWDSRFIYLLGRPYSDEDDVVTPYAISNAWLWFATRTEDDDFRTESEIIKYISDNDLVDEFMKDYFVPLQ